MDPGKSALHNGGSVIKRYSATPLVGLAFFACMTAVTGAFAQEVSASKPLHHQYRVVVLPVDGGADSLLAGYLFYAPLNPRGALGVLGDTGTPGVFNSYIWTAGRQTDLKPLPPLGNFSGSNTYVNWINQWSLSAGFATRTDSVTGASIDNAVIWTPDGRILDLVGKSNTESHAVWVNDLGEVSGWLAGTTADPCSFGTSLAQTEAFIWQFGTLRRLGSLGGTDSYGEFINDLGQVSGHAQTSNTPNSASGCPPFDPFVWQDGIMKDINPGNFGGSQGGTNYLNNRGDAVGFGTTAGELTFHPFLWQNGKTNDLNAIGTLGGASNSAFNVNDLGHVIGVNSTADNSDIHAVLWRDRKFTDLSTLSGDDCSEAFRINNSDQIVGISLSCETGVSHAFVWEHGEMVDLDTLIPSDAGIELTSANWISDDGVIAAQGFLLAGSDMGATRAVLLIPNGECDPAAQAAAALAAQMRGAARPSADESRASTSRKTALVLGADGRVDPMFFKPFSPAALRSKIRAQSN
jgi:probable HAF family extracellular repeat protein